MAIADLFHKAERTYESLLQRMAMLWQVFAVANESHSDGISMMADSDKSHRSSGYDDASSSNSKKQQDDVVDRHVNRLIASIGATLELLSS